MGGRPGEHQIGAHVLGSHHAISATVGLTGNNSNLADGGFRVSIQQFRPTANDAVVFLAGAGEEAGHIDKLDDGNVEGITGADKSCGFLCRSNIQAASKFGGLIGHHAHGSTFDPAEANDDIAGVAFLDFEEVAIINHVGDDIFHVVWLVGRIEIVQRAASTLYGAEAMGGVVNIILKKPTAEESEFKLSQTVGNYFKKSEATYTGDRIMVDVSREWSKNIPHSNAFGQDKLSWVDWWVGKGKKSRVGVIAQLTDELSLHYNYMEADITRGGVRYFPSGGRFAPATTGANKTYRYRYNDFRHTASLVYQGKENGVHAVLGYNYRKVDVYDALARTKKDSSNATMDSQIFDVQKQWKLGQDSMVLGYAYQREGIYFPVTKRSGVRTGNSLYASYSKQFTPKFNFTLGLRGEFINDPMKDQHVLIPQFQTNYQFDHNTAWYINAGRAFQMPTVDDASKYHNLRVSELKPEDGWTYETGVKIRRGNATWKAAVYHMEMKNKLGWKGNSPSEKYMTNIGDFRNTGFELEYGKRLNDVWKLTLGGSISNPQVKDPSADNQWAQDAGRLEGLVRIDYERAKWQGNLNLKYLGDREYYAPNIPPKGSGGAAQDVPDKIQLNMNVTYTAGRDDIVTLGIYNLLNRENYSNKYGALDLGRNFRLTYTHAF